MRTPIRILIAAVLLVAAVGCHSSSATTEPAASAPVSAGPIPIGPGPQHPYTVQKQPAPDTCQYRYTRAKEPLPDPKCTPGALSPAVTEANLATTICRSGYTLTIRPPENVTGPEKAANAASYHYTGDLHDAEEDHLLSLELGGDPNDPRNLWVEPPSPGHTPGAGPNNPKDAVESALHKAICAHKVKLADAQIAIVTDWTTAEHVVGIG